jgi:hypothetical protein
MTLNATKTTPMCNNKPYDFTQLKYQMIQHHINESQETKVDENTKPDK